MIDISKYCLPSKIYLALSLISVVFGALSEFSVGSLIFHVLLIGFWTLLLNWLCSKGLAVLSWGLVLIPYILIVLIFLFSTTDITYIRYKDMEDYKEGMDEEYQEDEEDEEEEQEGMQDYHQSVKEEDEDEEQEGMPDYQSVKEKEE
jgi:hypothetical protein